MDEPFSCSPLDVDESAGQAERCDYCGGLEWTRAIDGRVSHKHDCPGRVDDWCQAHPHGCANQIPGSANE